MKRKIFDLTIKTIVGVGVVITAYSIGAGIIPMNVQFSETASAHPSVDPFQTPRVEATLVSTHTVEYVQETVVETAFVDVVREVKFEIRHFDTLDTLETWVADECQRAIIRFNRSDSVIDCDDYAQEMQKKALEDGFIMSFDIITVEEYNTLFAIPLPPSQSLHAINLAIIGNSVFYIEPQTGEIVHAAYLD